MIRFSEIDQYVSASPGVYEIHTRKGVALKVGIGRDLRDRLRHHRASYQSGLRSKTGDLSGVTRPSEVVSKSSILAKHLFFDSEIGSDYDLRSETGRRAFLERECRVTVHHCSTRENARRIEKKLESETAFRYCRRVIVRPAPAGHLPHSHQGRDLPTTPTNTMPSVTNPMTSRKRVDEAGRAYAGSQLQLQLYVNRRQEELDGAITHALGLMPSSLIWVSPLENERFKEYSDAVFLKKLGLDELIPALREFWPPSGPRWDGLACVIHSRTVVLVEAKNYPAEVRGGGCKAVDITPVTKRNPVSRTTNARSRILGALTTAAQNLGARHSERWTGSLYQYANRIAHVDFLRRNGVDARMVNVCFTGDPHPSRFTSAAQWREACADLKSEIGFIGDAPKWLVDVLLPARDRAELVESERRSD